MTPLTDAALRSWPLDPWLTGTLLLAAIVYFRGWRIYRSRDPIRWTTIRLASFLAGTFAIFLALASPIEPFASLLLRVHMLQHLLLMMVAPPLIWLGAPLLPMVRGLPEPIRIYWIAPLFRIRWLRRIMHWLTQPATALTIFIAVTWTWHSPVLYGLALQSPAWHYVQHACFLVAGLLFWFPVVRPYPVRPSWPLWLLLPYLLLADLSNTALSALFTFSDSVLYPHYAAMPPIDGGNPLDDQAMAGVLMWIPGSLVYLLPLFGIGLRLLYGEKKQRPQRIPLSLAGSRCDPRFDLLRLPILGAFLRWRYARMTMQVPLLILAALIAYDGFTGPQVGSMNLAGVLPWIHWRGLLMLGLLVAGNVFCAACPLTLPRTLGRRWLPAGRNWPRRLRSKWLAIALLVLFFTSYEAFALWDSPWLTAWIIAGYFAAAFVIDGLFRGAAFCKYVCPIGQFNFVQSLVSPLEVSIRDPKICTTCKTKDCIRGRGGIPGCELNLYQPRKRGNMDCTFCLDCVHACPHDNIGIHAGAPGRGLAKDHFRSGVGRFGSRPDLAALAIVLVFAAFANAAGMIGPVLAIESRLQSELGLASPLPVVIAFYAFALIVLPAIAVRFAAWLSRITGSQNHSAAALALRFSVALIPLGFAMWLAHYGYHLATSYDVAWPVWQRFAADHALANLGEPDWVCDCCRTVGGWLPKTEIVILELGMLFSLLLAYRIASQLATTDRQRLAMSAPWMMLIGLLFVLGVWIIFQPMQMRGIQTG